ncbi:MAG: tetratricopeptide repeat protein [Alphaproteobacteria bacterium]|jgi:tetratricopeptide (TPR) repeat protein|nr:tetratricopeptide repeat protein [Alphaproteobacteria bacterium]
MLKAIAIAGMILASGPDHGPPDSMFEELKNAPTEEEAKSTALDIWAAWLESGSPTVDILMERALAAQSSGDLDKARALYDRAILIEPDYAEAWHRRATVFLAQERVDEALRDLNEALTHEPRHFGAWAGLGSILERFGAKQEALEAYRQALKIHPYMEPARRAEARLSKALDGTAL